MKREWYRPAMILMSALALTVPAAAGDNLPSLEQILDRYVEVMGGAEAIGRLESRVIVGRQIDDRPYRGPAEVSEMKVYATDSGDWQMILDQPEGEWREGCVEGKNWVRNPGGEIGLKETANTKLAFLFNPQGPLRLEDYFPNLRLTGTWVYDGVEYYQVENDLKFEYYTLYFEVETGMLTRIGYHWWLEGFRPVDGVLVPTKVVRGRKGGSTNLYFDEVTHGDDVTRDLSPRGR